MDRHKDVNTERERQIQKLIEVGTEEDKKAIERGRGAGRLLRRELEKMQ